LPGWRIVSWMSLWTVVRRGRVGIVKEAADDECACWMRVVGRPVSPAAGSNSAGMDADADAEVLGLGCSLALFLQWRTLWCLLAMYVNGECGER
jgi:hypothetical protein